MAQDTAPSSVAMHHVWEMVWFLDNGTGVGGNNETRDASYPQHMPPNRPMSINMVFKQLHHRTCTVPSASASGRLFMNTSAKAEKEDSGKG